MSNPVNSGSSGGSESGAGSSPAGSGDPQTTAQFPAQHTTPDENSSVGAWSRSSGPQPAGSTSEGWSSSPDFNSERSPQDLPVAPELTRERIVARQREQFGAVKLGPGFFGWLTATGMAVLLISILTAAGIALGYASPENLDQAVQESANQTGTARTVGLVGAIILLVILFVAYYSGGYVAGRMARFNGVKHGLAVWLWALGTTIVLAGLAALAGSEYNILAQLNLPRIPVDEGQVTTVGFIAIGAALLVTLLGAILGGKMGTRFHRRVDSVGFEAHQ